MGAIARLALAVAAVVLLVGCRTIMAELDPQTGMDREAAERNRQQILADLEACRKVTLLELGDEPFGPDSPDCTFIVWDRTMPGIEFEMGGSAPGLPKALVDGAEAGGFHKVCSFGSNYFEGWLRYLPPGQSHEGWNATMWTRAPRSERSAAVCDFVLR